MYKPLNFVSVTCRLRGEAPFNRGSGCKTYLFFSQEVFGLNGHEKCLEHIPNYEEVLCVRVYQNRYELSAKNSCEKNHFRHRLCRRCTLNHWRSSVVSFRGYEGYQPKIVFVGQSPGADEDAAGFAFVGPSGSLLEEMFRRANFTEPRLLTNMVACKPGDGPDAIKRDEPTLDEVAACSARLWQEFQILRPSIIVALGSVAAKMFWDKPTQYDRNTLYELRPGLLVGYMFHPAFLLRNMQKGGMFNFTSSIEFLRELNQKAVDTPRHAQKSVWTLLDAKEKFPFKYFNKIKWFK